MSLVHSAQIAACLEAQIGTVRAYFVKPLLSAFKYTDPESSSTDMCRHPESKRHKDSFLLGAVHQARRITAICDSTQRAVVRLMKGAWTVPCNLQAQSESFPACQGRADRPLLLSMLSQKEGTGALGFEECSPHCKLITSILAEQPIFSISQCSESHY